MTLKKVSKEDIESFTVVTHPKRFYHSSSQGVTGSVYVFARRSSIEKETEPLSSFVESKFNDSDIGSYLNFVEEKSKKLFFQINDSDSTPLEVSNASSEFNSLMQGYLDRANSQSSSPKKKKILNIIRFTPSVNFNSNTLRKLTVKDLLNPYYRTSFSNANWSYTNYNTLNFFTASTVPATSCLLYPNIQGDIPHLGYETGVYNLSGAFSFDFWINPRYRQNSDLDSFKPGTIFHLSSSYALSLVTGSLKDENGLASAFRLKLQLSHSADIAPSVSSYGSYPNDLIFLSEDNSLEYNKWSRVVVRWGTDLVNNGTGSFNINSQDKGFFVIPSGTINLQSMAGSSLSSPDVLCVGNYWEGLNQSLSSQSTFFATDPSTRDGLEILYPSIGVEEPSSYSFNHPLNAEIHELSIKRHYMTNEDIVASSSVGPSVISRDKFAFYSPPFFIDKSPFRQNVNSFGGVLQTPFFEINGTTNDPFNVAMSFGVNGHYINIENYTRDFANNVYPRLHHMTGTAIANTTLSREANEFLYDDSFVIRRNLFVLPCDNGKFYPNYSIIENEFKGSFFCTDDDGVQNYSSVSLNDLLSTSSLLFGAAFDSVEGEESVSAGDFVNQLIGFTPENPGTVPGDASANYKNFVDALSVYDPGVQLNAPLTVYQRTRDSSSNQVTFFDISNLFYGKNIKPGSFILKESNLSGSSGKVSVTLKDDGKGNLYRSNTSEEGPTWSSCGNIYYNEGIVAIKNPHLYFFGKDSFDIEFQGEQNIHSLKLEVIAQTGLLNSSSNPAYRKLPASSIKNDTDADFVYISGINFHDENLNIVAKSQLAQPIVKRTNSQILFKVGLDF